MSSSELFGAPHSEGWKGSQPPTKAEPRRWVRWSYIEEHPGEIAPTFEGWMWVKFDLGHSDGPVVILVPIDDVQVVPQGEAK